MDNNFNNDGANTNTVPQSSDPVQGAPTGAPEPTPTPGEVAQGPVATPGMSSDPVQGAPTGAPEPTPTPGEVAQGPVATDDSANGNA